MTLARQNRKTRNISRPAPGDSSVAQNTLEVMAMINQETLNKLKYMKMTGMAEALEHQEADTAYQEMSFQDRLGLAVDWEFSRRQHSRLQRLIRAAKFQNATACVEDIRYGDDRKLDRKLIL